MQLLVIAGSHRPTSQSGKVGRYIAKRAIETGGFSTAEVLDLSESDLPFWAEDAFDPSNETWKAHLDKLNEQLSAADAYVIISPEWHGMVPSKLKNLLLFASVRTMGHKPALITTVSGSRGGAYPVTELRSSGYKNARICYIPEHLIIRQAGEVLNDGAVSGEEDEYIRGRIDWTLGGLAEYARVMSQLNRELLVSKKYPNGM